MLTEYLYGTAREMTNDIRTAASKGLRIKVSFSNGWWKLTLQSV